MIIMTVDPRYSNTAMDDRLFIGDLPIATPISSGFPVATFHYQRVSYVINMACTYFECNILITVAIMKIWSYFNIITIVSHSHYSQPSQTLRL